jgi:predicted PurR-regulated permease PerM
MWALIVERLGDSSELTTRIGDRVRTALSGFIAGQTIIAACEAALIAVGALILGVPNVGAILMLTFVGAYVPSVRE